MTKVQDVTAAISSPKNATIEQMSDYERTRANNIQRNNARLRSLGLISVEEEEESNAIAWNQKVAKTSHTIKTSENQSLKRKRGVSSTTSSSSLVVLERSVWRIQGGSFLQNTDS